MSDDMAARIGGIEARIARLEKSNRNIALEVVKTRGDVASVGERMDEGFRRILGHLERAAADVESSQRERVLVGRTLSTMDSQLTEHEVRFYRLEHAERNHEQGRT